MDTKSQLIDQGYECRSGHTTGDWADFGWSHDTIGKECSFVIVKKDFPEIKHIADNGSLGIIYLTDGEQMEEYENVINKEGEWEEVAYIFGYGETEEEAWENAVETIDILST